MARHTPWLGAHTDIARVAGVRVDAKSPLIAANGPLQYLSDLTEPEDPTSVLKSLMVDGETAPATDRSPPSRPGAAHGSAGTRRRSAQPTQRRALRQIPIQGLRAARSPSVQLIWMLRKTRSGCGIMAVNRPSSVVTAVRPAGLPLGLKG